jgi:hypothetical protein
MLMNVAVEWAALLFSILEVLSSYIIPEVSFHKFRCFLQSFQASACKCPRSGHDHFSHIIRKRFKSLRYCI